MPTIRLKFAKAPMDDSTPAATAARRNALRRKAASDKVDPKKLAAISLSDGNKASGTRPAKRRSGNRQAPVAVSKRVGNGKVFQREPTPEDINSDDAVEPYSFTSEDEVEDDEEDWNDADSVITLSSESSTPPEEEEFQGRPWKNFDNTLREQWEKMYSNVTAHPLSGNWELTEDYQREKDAEMLRYLDDFPIHQWIIPHVEANKAYVHLQERNRWRSQGIRVYGRDRAPPWELHALATSQPPQSVNPTRDPLPDGTQAEPPRQAEPRMPKDRQHSERLPRPEETLNHATTHVREQPQPQPMVSQHAGPPHAIPPPQPHQAPHMLPHHPQGQLPYLPPGPPPGHPMYQGHPHPAMFGPPLGPNGFFPAGHGPHFGPPPHALPSQPYAHPIPVPPGPIPPHGFGPPMGPPFYGPPGPFPPQMLQQPRYAPRPRRDRGKKDSPLAPSTPPPPPPTPPYTIRHKPTEKKSNNKAGRRSARKQAEAEEFPWTRKLDFREAKEKASWNDGIYDRETLDILERTRAGNIPIIDDLDAKVQESQRVSRAAKKDKDKDKRPDVAESSDAEASKSSGKKKMQRGQRKVDSHGDPYHSGAFAFASVEDERKANNLGYKCPDDAIEAGEANKLSVHTQGTIKIYWNPGKKGMTENLEQIKFTIKDTVATRKQLASTPVLTKRAAECVIDFCPDMLWRGMLLRICSEAGYGNKDVRDRFCYNGCYCDKATITKRISAALGQKQVQPKSKGYGPGEWEWYDENVKDFAKYIDYFGKRTSHRNMLKIQMQGEKRKMKQREFGTGLASEGNGEMDGDAAVDMNAMHSGNEDAGPSKRSRSEDAGPSSEAVVNMEEGNESDGSDESDAVSVQDSDILDKMEED